MIGFPRGALRMAIGYHKKTLTSHAVLTVETKQGTYVMDSTNDQIHIWPGASRDGIAKNATETGQGIQDMSRHPGNRPPETRTR